MFASLDCMHYEWKNCPLVWQGDYGDRKGKKSIILEAITENNLHIWHAFFGLPGSNNDVNVLDCSPLVHNMLSSEARDMHFVVNGRQYNHYYSLLGLISCNQFTFSKMRSEGTLPLGKRQYGRMLRDVLGSYKLDLLLLGTPIASGAWTLFRIS